MQQGKTVESDAMTAEQPGETVAKHTAGWLSASVARVKVVSELALAEAKLAASSVALMAFLGTIAAVCVIAAWGLVVAGGVVALLALGVPLWAILMLLALGHLAIAGLLARRILALTAHLEFSATRQQLRTNEATS